MIKAVADAHGQFLDIISQKTMKDPRTLKDFIGKYEAENGPLTPERRQELVEGLKDRSRFVLEVDQQAGLRIIGASDEVKVLLFNMSWTILEAFEGCFITSDGPVVRYSPPETHSPFYGDGGFLNAEVKVSFPLSPQKCLLITRPSPAVRGFVPVGLGSTVDINRRTAYYAARTLYADRKDEGIRLLADETKETDGHK